MASAGRKGILPLEPFSMTAVPTTTHNVAWSPDAELAIGCDDCIFLFLPQFSSHKSLKGGRGPSSMRPARQYNEVALRFPCMELRSPELNRPLFDIAGQGFPEFAHIPGGGSNPVTSQASSMNHVVAMEWSPCGLGCMKRSVLAVLVGGGFITIYCEGVSDDMSAFKLGGRNARSLRHWAAAWGVGAGLLLPTAEGREEVYSREYITAFSWAKDTDEEANLLAYTNDDDEIVIISVQADHSPKALPGSTGDWRVEEVARFYVDGPHPKTDPTDQDHSPSGSSHSLSWSPWCDQGRSKVCMISYIRKNYVGFRKITIHGRNKSTKTPNVRVGDVDANGVCLYLAPDAFIVWTNDDAKFCRGMIATPYKVQTFQLPLDTASPSPIVKHATDKCHTTYPTIDNLSLAQNPITGLVIHPPTSTQPTSAPLYTLVRLSATHENPGWYQTNVPPPPPPPPPTIPTPPSTTYPLSTGPPPGSETLEPRWAHEILQSIEQQLPRALAYRPVIPSRAGSTPSSDDDDDNSDSAASNDDPPWEEDASDYGMGGDGDTTVVNGIDTADLVHVARARIWGMAASPGGGVTAVFAALHSAVKPGRDTFAGWKCRVLFGRHDGAPSAAARLSTEGRMWEWMYGGGPPVTGVSAAGTEAEVGDGGDGGDKRAVLRDHFRPVALRQVCAFCLQPLEPITGATASGKETRCRYGHLFDTCATTGVPILAPGVSKTCNVCGSKCLKREELLTLAPQLRDIVLDEISAEFCGGCGGKFVN
ncbi:hypothetical protein F4779DRAFT_633134 [Xylariaceae sp. FL0662B]|nr:hypothetical protein F4779DRAFT_633134 [Xylariaceae sp. FL0662B]